MKGYQDRACKELPLQRALTVRSKVPAEFLLLSEAIDHLTQGMWGGLKRPAPLVQYKTKPSRRDDFAIFGRWREKSAEVMTTAALKGRLTIHVVADLEFKAGGTPPYSTENLRMAVVPRKVLEGLITTRGRLPDQAFRPTLKTAGGDQRLLALLHNGLLVVQRNELAKWYRAERAKRRWPSQRDVKKAPLGRPSKQSDELRTAVWALANDDLWAASAGIPALRTLLIERGQVVPSDYTLRRLVKRMHAETGEKPFWRRKNKLP